MLHPDITELISYARSKSFHKVMMISNAYLLNEKKVQALNDAGLMEMQVSVDGVLPNDVTVKVLKPKLLTPGCACWRVPQNSRSCSAQCSARRLQAQALKVVEAAQEFGLPSARAGVTRWHRPKYWPRRRRQGRLRPRQVRCFGGRFREGARLPRHDICKTGSAPFKCHAGRSLTLRVDEFGRRSLVMLCRRLAYSKRRCFRVHYRAT